jgi:hypothetical protein
MTAFITGQLGLGTLVDGAFTEPTAVEYGRQPITFTTVTSGAMSSDQAQNYGSVVTSWGTLTSFCVFTDAAGHVFTGSLGTPINAAPGENVTVLQGAITLTFSA